MRKLLKIGKRIIWPIIILLIPLLSVAVVLVYQNPRVVVEENTLQKVNYLSKKTAIDLEFEKMSLVQKQPINVTDLHINGWIPDWDMKDGTDTLIDQADTFDSISPIYYFVNPDGSLKSVFNANYPRLEEFTRENSIELIPTIQEFDADNLSLVLNKEENWKRHNDEIIAILTANKNYAGIDLDYESTKLADKDKFFEMLSDLSVKMKKINKKLVFTVLPKWGNEITYSFLPQTRKVQDWKRVADLVDELRIMTYELYGGKTLAGPIGPLEWLEWNIKYAITEGIDRNKIMLGVHTYSYDWSERELVEKIDYKNYFHDPAIIKDLTPGVALFNTDINKIRAGYNFVETFNEEWGEAVGRYDFRGQQRIVVFPTDRTFELRKKLAAEYGIKGIAYWRIGDEGGLKL